MPEESMKSFLQTLLGVIVANLLIFGFLVFAIGIVVVALKAEAPKIEAGSVLVQTIDGELPEYAPPTEFPAFGSTPMSHTTILENLEKARVDKRIQAVVLRIGLPGLGYAKMDELTERIQALRKAGKPVIGYVESLNNRSIYLGAACDSLLMMRNGYVSLHGFASERPFFKGTLEKLGIRDDIHRIEKYKSAAEMIQRKEMSPESRRNIEWMLDVYYPNFLRTVEEGRGLEPGSFESIALAQGAMIPREALAAHLVDRLVYWDEVESSLLRIRGIKPTSDDKHSLGPRPRIVLGSAYAKVTRAQAGIGSKKKIAVVHAQGMIAGEKSGWAFPFGMTMGGTTMEEALRQAAENDDVAAIVFRVDSGGGESAISWRIGRAARRAATVKPLVVSMVDMAASGAYMISYPCTTLVADRLSVVGSIGSISGKFNMRGFYDKIGLTKDYATRGPNGLMDSDYYDYTPEQFAAFTDRHWKDYYEWVEDVARVRGLTPTEVDSVGRGRVWTGEQALERHLIDHLGTFDDAVRMAKEQAGIPANQDVAYIHYPKPESPIEALRNGELMAALVSVVHRTIAPLEKDATWAVDWNDYR
jgi:protease IV